MTQPIFMDTILNHKKRVLLEYLDWSDSQISNKYLLYQLVELI
jgi:hypothetical protein